MIDVAASIFVRSCVLGASEGLLTSCKKTWNLPICAQVIIDLLREVLSSLTPMHTRASHHCSRSRSRPVSSNGPRQFDPQFFGYLQNPAGCCLAIVSSGIVDAHPCVGIAAGHRARSLARGAYRGVRGNYKRQHHGSRVTISLCTSPATHAS